MPSAEITSLIAAPTALGSVIVGLCVAARIAKKQINATMLSGNRQAWNDTFAVDAVGDWLGSASPGVWDGAHTWSPPFWDAAAFWGVSAMVGTALLVTAPDFIRGLWQWSNGGTFGDSVTWFMVPLFSVHIAAGFIPIVIAWFVLSRVF